MIENINGFEISLNDKSSRIINIDIGEEILKPYDDLLVPQAGFFLWLKVKDDKKAAKMLWGNFSLKK